MMHLDSMPTRRLRRESCTAHRIQRTHGVQYDGTVPAPYLHVGLCQGRPLACLLDKEVDGKEDVVVDAIQARVQRAALRAVPQVLSNKHAGVLERPPAGDSAIMFTISFLGA